MAIGAIGEGWHNWHHKYPYDYATSEHGIFSQYNPTKLFIDTGAMLGVIWDRKRATSAWLRLKQSRLIAQQAQEELDNKDNKDKDSTSMNRTNSISIGSGVFSKEVQKELLSGEKIVETAEEKQLDARGW